MCIVEKNWAEKSSEDVRTKSLAAVSDTPGALGWVTTVVSTGGE